MLLFHCQLRRLAPIFGMLAIIAAMLPAHRGWANEPLIAELVTANRILFDQHILDGFGHVSARNPQNPRRFFMARAMSPGLVTRADIIEIEIESGAPVTPLKPPARTNSERFIHSEIYKVRPDVHAVVHSHSPNTIPFSVTKVPLRPIFHDASHLHTGVPVFEMRTVAGDSSDLLVRNSNLGKALAATLGNNAVVLMCGHGNAVVANNLRVVTFRSVFTEVNARMLIQALALGGPIEYLSAGEGATLDKYTVDVGIDRVWDVWKSRAEGGNAK